MTEIILSEFTDKDINQLIKWVDAPSSANLWASRTYAYPLTPEKIQVQLTRSQRTPVELKIFNITLKKSGEIVGHVELDKFDHHVGSTQITRLFISPNFRRMNIAKNAIKNLLQYCFINLNLNRVEIMAIEINQPALDLYLKLGFKQEGFLRENMLLEGNRYGSYLLSMLKNEFLDN